MINDKTIAVVVPAFNEASQIGMVIETMPDFVDRIIIVNDCSSDATEDAVKKYFKETGIRVLPEIIKLFERDNMFDKAELLIEEKNREEILLFPEANVIQPNKEQRLVLINLKQNHGKGAATAIGYKWAKDNNIDCTAVMDGDGQMDPRELESICNPIIFENVDYVKGNRLRHKSAKILIPKTRFIGNSILSILTKIASGYWRVSDPQTGYTAISKDALNSINIYDIYKRYGIPNDILVKINIAFCTLKEVNIKPVYNIGEKSKMRPVKVILPISWLLLKSFFKRLWIKYLFRDFHPLFIFYHLSFFLFTASIPYGIKILRFVLTGQSANPTTVLALIFLLISGFQFLLFAMWMDMQDNDRLYK